MLPAVPAEPLNYAIIDEVDNILIDEARTPLIISAGLGRRSDDVPPSYAEGQTEHRPRRSLIDAATRSGEPGVYFEVKEKERTCHLTDEGIREAEELAGVESFYTAGNMEWPHLIDNALKAHHLYQRDSDYMVDARPENGEMASSSSTSSPAGSMIGRQWSDGLHQAVEAKHAATACKIKEETQTLATITLQNFFKLYKKLAGMTGTAMTEANEFWKIYKLDVIAIPTNRPLIRVNHADVVYRTEKEKWDAVVDEIERGPRDRPADPGRHHGRGQVARSSPSMLKRARHQARAAQRQAGERGREAEIVAQAGRIGGGHHRHEHGRPRHRHHPRRQPRDAWPGPSLKRQVRRRPASTCPRTTWKATVDEIEAKEKMKEEGRKVAEMGGLHIVGTERHEAAPDRQPAPRPGRPAGRPRLQPVLPVAQDDLMRIFAGEWVANVLTRLGMEEGEAIESRMVRRRIEAAQKKVEERNFDIRKNLLEYDEVMDHQRKRVYGFRQEILDGAQLARPMILDMIDEQIDAAVDRFLDDDYGAGELRRVRRQPARASSSRRATSARTTSTRPSRSARDKAIRHVPTVDPGGDRREPRPRTRTRRSGTGRSWPGRSNAAYGLKTRRTGPEEDRPRRTWPSTSLDQAEKAGRRRGPDRGQAVPRPRLGRRVAVRLGAGRSSGIKLTAEELAGQGRGRGQGAASCEQVRGAVPPEGRRVPGPGGDEPFMAEKATGGGRPAAVQPARGCTLGPDPASPDVRAERPDRGGLPHRVAGQAARDAAGDQPPRRTRRPTRPRSTPSWTRPFSGTRAAEAEDAKELADWIEADARGRRRPGEADRQAGRDGPARSLWNAFDDRYRPEMHRMERSLVLDQLDRTWKNHLLTMDHLRIGRRPAGLRPGGPEDGVQAGGHEGVRRRCGRACTTG